MRYFTGFSVERPLKNVVAFPRERKGLITDGTHDKLIYSHDVYVVDKQNEVSSALATF
jgi:hypothetical protein